MTVPLTTSSLAWESTAWQELENVFAALAQLARSEVAPQDFYRSLLDHCLPALAAKGGAVWLRSASGVMQPIVQVGRISGESLAREAERDSHELLLRQAATEGRVICLSPHASLPDTRYVNPTEYALLLGPVSVATPTASDDRKPPSLSQTTNENRTTLALLELWLPAEIGPTSLRGYEQFLTAICELAADYHAFAELRSLRHHEQYLDQLLKLGRQVHREANLPATAFAAVNEGRNVVGCDRLSVLVARGRGCRLLATNGASHIERRSTAARGLEHLAELVRRTDEPAYYRDGESDALPPVAAALEQHAEQSHARQISVVPVRPPAAAHADHAALSADHQQSKRPQFVLVAEQFDSCGGPSQRERLLEVAEVCATALHNALEHDRLPFLWLLRPLGSMKRQVTEHLPRTALVLALVTAIIAALVFVPAEFQIEAAGTLQPVIKRDVFAPRNGLVDEVLISHGQEVTAGQELVRLRDPALDLELKRVDGEWETVQRQLDAVRTTRTNRAIREVNPADDYRLSAEEQQLEQRLANLQRERELLNREREHLVVASPIAGRVLTWDVANRISARPVERGEVLLTVADLTGPWQLELEVPDDRIGYLLAASEQFPFPLPVRFRLSSDDRERHTGQIVEISQMANMPDVERSRAVPTVLVKVALDSPRLHDAARRDLRPGISARAQIACGRRSLGYVWLHDMWNMILEWLHF